MVEGELDAADDVVAEADLGVGAGGEGGAEGRVSGPECAGEGGGADVQGESGAAGEGEGPAGFGFEVEGGDAGEGGVADGGGGDVEGLPGEGFHGAAAGGEGVAGGGFDAAAAAEAPFAAAGIEEMAVVGEPVGEGLVGGGGGCEGPGGTVGTDDVGRVHGAFTTRRTDSSAAGATVSPGRRHTNSEAGWGPWRKRVIQPGSPWADSKRQPRWSAQRRQ